MTVRSNPHTHTNRVDGKNTAREQIEKALECGFVSLGFTEHAQEKYCGLAPGETEAYIQEITALKREYASRIRIWLGIERDAISDDCFRDSYDYVLGASHYLNAPDGKCFAIDSGAQELEEYVNTYLSGSWDDAVNQYFDSYASYIEDYKPDIIAHFDLILKNNRKMHWFDETSPAFIESGRRALERMIKACDVLEVNTGGMARSFQPCPYPVMPLLSYWHKLGGRVIPSSDCHRAYQLDACFDTVPDYIRQAGFETALMLGTGEQLFEEYRL